MNDMLRQQAPANQCEGRGTGGELMESDYAPGPASASASSQPARSDMQLACTQTLTLAGWVDRESGGYKHGLRMLKECQVKDLNGNKSSRSAGN